MRLLHTVLTPNYSVVYKNVWMTVPYYKRLILCCVGTHTTLWITDCASTRSSSTNEVTIEEYSVCVKQNIQCMRSNMCTGLKKNWTGFFFESKMPFQLTMTSESIILNITSRQTVLTWSLTFSKLPVWPHSLCAKPQAENMHNFWCLMSRLHLKLKCSVLKC